MLATSQFDLLETRLHLTCALLEQLRASQIAIVELDAQALCQAARAAELICNELRGNGAQITAQNKPPIGHPAGDDLPHDLARELAQTHLDLCYTCRVTAALVRKAHRSARIMANVFASSGDVYPSDPSAGLLEGA